MKETKNAQKGQKILQNHDFCAILTKKKANFRETFYFWRVTFFHKGVAI